MSESTNVNPASQNCVGYSAGMSAETTTALQDVTVALMQIANLSNDLERQMAEAEKQATLVLAKSNEQMGQDEASALRSQGIGSIIGGSVGFAFAVGGSLGDSDLEESHAQMKGLEGYKNMMDGKEACPATGVRYRRTTLENPVDSDSEELTSVGSDKALPTESESRLASLKERDKFYTGSKRKLGRNTFKSTHVEQEDRDAYNSVGDKTKKDVRAAIEKKYKAAEEAFQSKSNALSARSQKLTTFAQAINGISNGAGQAHAANADEDKGIQQAHASTLQSALQGMQAIDNQERNASESNLSKALEVDQNIAAISSANKMNS